MLKEKEEDIKFIADDMVGKLAKWLRIIGYDVKYYHHIEDDQLIEIANRENRILLTRDSGIVQSEKARKCIFVKSDGYREQLRELFTLLPLKVDENKTFSRCLICNETLKEISKEDIRDKVPPFVFKTQEDFVYCPNCSKIYWKGTHGSRVEEILKIIS